MAYHRKVTIKRSRKTAKVPDHSEWEEYKQYMKDRGQILVWKMSEFDSDNTATLQISMDSKESWNELVNQTIKNGHKLRHPQHMIVSDVEV